MQKLKILHIIKSLGRGGAEMLLPETLKLHNQSRFEFHYIYFLPWKNQMVDAIEKAGGKVHCLSASNNIQMMLKQNDVLKYCEDHQIDLIHCHLPWSGFLGRIIYNRTRIPVIYTEHNIQERYHKATKFLNRFTFNSQSLALGVSKDVTRSILENIKPKIPVQTLLNGVNTKRFQKDAAKRMEIRKQFNIPATAVVVGNIAVFREQKGLLNWIKAFEVINKSFPDAYGILVGAGPKEEELKHMVAEKGLDEKIKFAGLQTDTVSYFSSMDIFMMSSFFEGLPIALLEAMSMECAVVSTKAGGVVEVVRNGRDGLLCEVGEWESLGKIACDLIQDTPQREALQQAARKRVENSFSLSVMVNDLEQVYDNFLVKPAL